MKKSFYKKKLLILLLSGIIIIFLFNVFQKNIRGFFYYFSAPIQKSFWEAGKSSSDFLQGIKDFGSLKNKVDNLEQKNQGLIAEIIKLKSLEEENKTLRSALEIEIQKEYNLAFANIVSKDISQEYILIDRGFNDGILKEMPVITEEKILIGKVVEVYNNNSKVVLLSCKDFSFDVVIKKEEKEIAAVAQGQGNSKIRLNYVPQEADIFENDLITTSYLGGIFPENLLVGRIESFKKNDADPFQIVEANLTLRVQDIKNVFIILEF